MNKYLLKTICFLFISVIAFAQSKDEKKYKERAAEVGQDIWNNSDSAFKVTQVPEKYNNESAVIIARAIEITNSAKRKFKMVTIFGGSVKQYTYYTTLRERILIKDKSALEEYSTLNYKKLADNTVRMSVYKLLNTSTTYIGAKIFKQGGKVIEVNPDEEEVLTNDSKKDKEGKIAIPDLQVGDILDYYIRIEQVKENENSVMGPHVYFLGDDHPILYYNVRYVLDKKSGADAMSMNGATDIKESRSEDDDLILEHTDKDLPKISSTLWTSAARQIPYYVVRCGFPGSGILAKAGQVRTGPFTTNYKNNLRYYLLSIISSVDKSPRKTLEDYFGGKKIVKDLPADSIVNYLFNYYRWQQYGTFSNMDVTNKRNYNNMNWYNLSVSFSELLRTYEIKSDIILVCNRYSGRLDEVFGVTDFELMLRINSDGKYKWISFNGFFNDAGQVGANYQGEEGLVLSRNGSGLSTRFTSFEDPIKLPVANSDENVAAENIKVSFNKENLQVVTIDRNCKMTGIMKHNDQKNLLLAEDVEAGFATLIDKMKATDKLAEGRRTKDKAGEVQAALDKERSNQKDYFKTEIKDQYDQEPKELLSYKIINDGLSVYKPVFEYNETFTMDNFVKKAGNNFIFDIGRLMGSYKKLDEKETNRTLDVYMPSARKLIYECSVTLPEGYNAKGIEELNKKVENDISSFQTTARLDGNTVTLTITRTYKNNFEPAANWPKLLSVMNAAADFTSLKLLLEKKK